MRDLFGSGSAGLGQVLEHGMLPLAVQGRRPRGFLRSDVETYLHEEVQSGGAAAVR